LIKLQGRRRKRVSGKIQKKWPLFSAISFLPCQIARRTELHDDVERRLLPVDDAVVVFHNVRVPQPLEQVDLGNQKCLQNRVRLAAHAHFAAVTATFSRSVICPYRSAFATTTRSSLRRRTRCTVPNEPLPISSNTSYCTSNSLVVAGVLHDDDGEEDEEDGESLTDPTKWRLE
jgi:hypothetical protein